jgi:hypothetical protein
LSYIYPLSPKKFVAGKPIVPVYAHYPFLNQADLKKGFVMLEDSRRAEIILSYFSVCFIKCKNKQTVL